MNGVGVSRDAENIRKDVRSIGKLPTRLINSLVGYECCYANRQQHLQCPRVQRMASRASNAAKAVISLISCSATDQQALLEVLEDYFITPEQNDLEYEDENGKIYCCSFK